MTSRESNVDLSSCVEKVKESAKRANDLSNFIAILRVRQITKVTKYIEPLKHEFDKVIIELLETFEANSECLKSNVPNWLINICIAGVSTIILYPI